MPPGSGLCFAWTRMPFAVASPAPLSTSARRVSARQVPAGRQRQRPGASAGHRRLRHAGRGLRHEQVPAVGRQEHGLPRARGRDLPGREVQVSDQLRPVPHARHEGTGRIDPETPARPHQGQEGDIGLRHDPRDYAAAGLDRTGEQVAAVGPHDERGRGGSRLTGRGRPADLVPPRPPGIRPAPVSATAAVTAARTAGPRPRRAATAAAAGAWPRRTRLGGPCPAVPPVVARAATWNYYD